MVRETRREISFGSRGPRTFSLPFVSLLLPFVLSPCVCPLHLPVQRSGDAEQPAQTCTDAPSSGDEASAAWLRSAPSQHAVGGRRGGRGCQDKETPLVKVAPGQAAEPREWEMLLSLSSRREVAVKTFCLLFIMLAVKGHWL